MRHGIALEASASGAPLLAGALGWLECGLHAELLVATHTLFVGQVLRVELGEDAAAAALPRRVHPLAARPRSNLPR